MTATLTQSTAFVASTTSTTQAITIPATASGATVLIYCEGGDNDGAISSIAGGSGTWASLASLSDANVVTSVWKGTGLTTGTTTVTLTMSASDNPVAVVNQWAAATGTLDVSATVKSAASGTTWTSNAAATTASDVVTGAVMGWTGTSAPTITPPATGGWINQTAAKGTTGTNDGIWVQTGYQVVPYPGSYTYAGSVSISSHYHAYVVAIKQATSAVVLRQQKQLIVSQSIKRASLW